MESQQQQIQHFIINIKGGQEQTEVREQSCFKEGSIFEVSQTLKKEKKKAYTPLVVSFGPIHHSKFKNKEEHKAKYSEAFITRAKLSRKYFLDGIRVFEANIRKSYSGISNRYDNNQLVDIISQDAFFILEYFMRDMERKGATNVLENFQDSDLQNDIILIENQLPMFVLEKIFNLSGLNSQIKFLDLVFNYFKEYNKQGIKPGEVHAVHFTDLLRLFMLPLSPCQGLEVRKKMMIDGVPSVTKLFKAGFSFEASKKKCLLDIEIDLQERVLKMPKFHIDQRREVHLKNILAFEESVCSNSENIIEYCYLLSCLVREKEDAQMLIGEDIIKGSVNDVGAIVTVIKSLTNKITIDSMSSKYLVVCKDLKDICANPDNIQKAKFMHRWFASPWKRLTTVVGVFLIISGVIIFIVNMRNNNAHRHRN